MSKKTAPKTASKTSKLDAAKTALYNRLRIQVFICTWIGYAGYYFVRNNLSAVSNHTNYDATAIGFITFGGYFFYGISKWVSGSLSDRFSSRLVLGGGLLASGLINIAIGTIPAVTATAIAFFIAFSINGWVQGMGYGPGAKTLVYWFAPKERSIWATVWNWAHNIGGMVAPTILGVSLAVFSGGNGDNWRSGFTVLGSMAVVIAIIVFIFMKETPESLGLPKIEDFKNDHPLEAQKEEIAEEAGLMEITKKYLLSNRKFLSWCMTADSFICFVTAL
jgi:OPA family glycerol-3-phosphate transporter-like MFS transporter